MRQMESRITPIQTEAPKMGREQIQQQHGSEQMPAREHRNSEPVGCRGPPDQQALEIAFLYRVSAELDLGQRSHENQHGRRRQADQGQLHRRHEIENSMPDAHFEGPTEEDDLLILLG